jgi:hypothetical protein
LNGVAGIQKEMKQTIVSTYANRLLPVGIFYFIKMAKEIQLTQGKVAIVDDEDYEYLNQWKWYANKLMGKFYAVRNNRINKKHVGSLIMHRILMKTPKDLIVDHINGNTLDNRKCNLRNCTYSQNSQNQKISIKNTSGYKGVYYQKRDNNWRVIIKCNNIRIHIGIFECIIDAAKAYNAAALKYHGEFANLNKID